MPRELEPLYIHLLELIDPFYLPWVSKALQILRNNHDLVEKGVVPLTVQGFLFAIQEDLDETTVKSRTSKWLDAKCEDISVRLTARCAGLLEVSSIKVVTGELFRGPESNIQYFHRTVKDFLEKETHWCKILEQTAATDFNPNVSIMRSSLLSIQFALANNCRSIQALQKEFITYTYYADAHSKSHGVQFVLLDKIKETMDIKSYYWWKKDFLPIFKGLPDFLELVTLYGLRGYVSAKLAGGGQLRDKERAIPLLRCLQ
jgi:hypothetical protein